MYNPFGLLGLIALVYLLFAHFRLRARVDSLEKSRRPTSQSVGEGVASVVTPPPRSAEFTPTPAPAAPAVSAPAPLPVEDAQGWWPKFTKWVSEDWLVKLGGLIILLGFAWLATYAFLHGWIGPMGRITLGLIGGTLLLALGWWRIQRFAHQGSIFLVLGSSAVLLTTCAARWIYDFFTPTSALLLMFASTVFVALASLKFRIRSLAVVSILLAGVVPFLTRMPEANDLWLFSYLLVIVVGGIWIVAKVGWRVVTMASLTVITVHSLPYFSSSVSADIALLFAYIFAAIFFIATTLSFILRVSSGGERDDLIIAGWNGLLLLGWILSEASKEWQSLILSFWTIVFLLGAFVVFRITAERGALISYGAVGVLFLGAATAVELEGAALTIAFALEAGALVVASNLLLKSRSAMERTALLLAIPATLSLPSIADSSWRGGVVFTEDFFVLLVIALVFMFVGWYIVRARKQLDETVTPGSMTIGSTLFVIGTVYAYILLWLSLGVMYADRVAVPVALFIYTVIGLWCYLRGRVRDQRFIRVYGGALVGFVVLRMLVVEVWDMELTARIFTFFIIGALLMSTAFIGRKK